MPQRTPQLVPASDVLAHRGIWREASEQNSVKALRSAWEQGFGVETDIRDLSGSLVVSHDLPGGSRLFLDDVLAWSVGRPGVLALNIKADGLGPKIKLALERFAGTEAFAFDMSVPQARALVSSGIPIAARVSDFESTACLMKGPYAAAEYLWIDCFDSDWFLNDYTLVEALAGRTGILVSPEVHGRNFQDAWSWIRALRTHGYRVGLCTDHPLEFMAWQGQDSSM